MSLETILTKDNVKSFFGKLIFKEYDWSLHNFDIKSENNRGQFYRNRFTKKVCSVDNSGKILLRGLVADSFVSFDYAGSKYIQVNVESPKGRCIFKQDGSLAFGGLHHQIGMWNYLAGKLFYNAQKEKGGLWAFYGEDGSILDMFGGKYHENPGQIGCHKGANYFFTRSSREDLDKVYCEDGTESDLFSNQNFKKNSLSQIGDELYFHGWELTYGQYGFLNSSDTFIPDRFGSLLKYKDNLSALGLWDKFFVSATKTYLLIEYKKDPHSWHRDPEKCEDRERFLKSMMKDLDERIAKTKGDPISYEKSIRQFVLGLEYLATHPNEAVNFVGGLRE